MLRTLSGFHLDAASSSSSWLQPPMPAFRTRLHCEGVGQLL